MAAQQEFPPLNLFGQTPDQDQRDIKVLRDYNLAKVEFGIFPLHEAIAPEGEKSLVETAAAEHGFSTRVLGEEEVVHNGHVARYTAPKGFVIAEFKPIFDKENRDRISIPLFHHVRAQIDVLRGQRMQTASQAQHQA